jgi:hypothetical protein
MQELTLEFVWSGASTDEVMRAVLVPELLQRSVSPRMEFRPAVPTADLVLKGTGGAKIAVIEPVGDLVAGADRTQTISLTRERLALLIGRAKADGIAVVLATIFRRTSLPKVGTAPFLAYRSTASRINLTICDLSCEAGVFVLDVDQILTEIGEQQLQSDPASGERVVAEHFGKILLEDGLLDYALEVGVASS